MSKVIEVNHEYDMNADRENCKKKVLQEVKDRSSNACETSGCGIEGSLSDPVQTFEDISDGEVSHDMETGANERKESETVGEEGTVENYLPVKGVGNMPKVGQRVRYLAADSNDWKKSHSVKSCWESHWKV